MRDDPLILPLDSPAATLDHVGGKGANLALLARAGLPVPGGFLVTTAAYRRFTAAHGLDAAIARLISGLDAADPAALDSVSERIRALFTGAELPAPLADALRVAYAAQGVPPVAVRSSATAEDLPDLSFAGQQDTYLNVAGEDALLRAVVACWASLWTARAIGYRARNGIEQSQVALAVVVQEMVASEASGVLFTTNPLTGARGETVIDATLGLGEALVSGQVEPDQFIVETASGRILQRTLGAKALSIRPVAGGGVERRSESAAAQQAIPDAVIRDLTHLGARVAGLYGAPQDIEWAWADERLYLLQARPITSLYPVPAGMPPEPLRVMFSFGAVQGMLDPMTPFGIDIFRHFAAGIAHAYGLAYTPADVPAIQVAGQRMWIAFDALLRNRFGRGAIRRILSMIEPGAGQALEEVLADPRLAPGRALPRPATVVSMERVFAPIQARLLDSLARPDAARAATQAHIERLLAAVQQRAAAATTLAERVAVVKDITEAGFPLGVLRVVPVVAAGLLSLQRLHALLASSGLDPDTAMLVVRGLPHNVTTEMDLILWDTAQAIRRDPAALAAFQAGDPADLAADYLVGQLPPAAQAALDRFLAAYGMRGVAEIDIGRPRWQEDPRQVAQTLQSYLQIEDPQLAPDAAFRRSEAAAAQAIEDIAAALARTPGGPAKARLARVLAYRVRALAGLRESPKFLVMRIFGALRAMLLAAGRDLTDAGTLAAPEDVFFLTLDELKAVDAGYSINWRALVAERRAVYDREKLRRQVPRLLVSDGRAFYEGMRGDGSAAGDGVLVGSPVSPGVVEGVAHVVLDPHSTRLAPGEILVCPGTDPAWTPLFLAAGGLVMEVGGLMTHGSVVAREYGIPAVVGVHEATTRLRSGQRIRVDGSAGRVTVLDGQD